MSAIVTFDPTQSHLQNLQELLNSVVADDADYNRLMDALQQYTEAERITREELQTERDEALWNLSELEYAIAHHYKTSHPIVRELVNDVRTEALDEASESSHEDGYNDALGEIARTFEELLNLSTGKAQRVARVLTDYVDLMNNEEAQAHLQALYLVASGETE